MTEPTKTEENTEFHIEMSRRQFELLLIDKLSLIIRDLVTLENCIRQELKLLSNKTKGLHDEVRIVYKIPITLLLIGIACYGFFKSEPRMQEWVFVAIIALAIQPLGFNFINTSQGLSNIFKSQHSNPSSKNHSEGVNN